MYFSDFYLFDYFVHPELAEKNEWKCSALVQGDNKSHVMISEVSQR